MKNISYAASPANTNSLLQTKSANNSTDIMCRKEALARNEADTRYRKAIRMAKFRNQNIKNFVLSTYSKSLNEYCGEKYVANKISRNEYIGLDDHNIEIAKSIKNKFNMLGIIDPKVTQNLLQSYIYQGCIQAVELGTRTHDVFVYNKQSNSLFLHDHQATTFRPISVQKYLCTSYGYEHVASPFFKHIHLPDGNDAMVNVVDLFCTFFTKLNYFMEKFIEDGGEVELHLPTYKEANKLWYGRNRGQVFDHLIDFAKCIYSPVNVEHEDKYTEMFIKTEASCKVEFLQSKLDTNRCIESKLNTRKVNVLTYISSAKKSIQL